MQNESYFTPISRDFKLLLSIESAMSIVLFFPFETLPENFLREKK